MHPFRSFLVAREIRLSLSRCRRKTLSTFLRWEGSFPEASPGPSWWSVTTRRGPEVCDREGPSTTTETEEVSAGAGVCFSGSPAAVTPVSDVDERGTKEVRTARGYRGPTETERTVGPGGFSTSLFQTENLPAPLVPDPTLDGTKAPEV